MDFSRRADAAELMDQPCDYETFRGCLRDLAQVNVVTLAYRPTLGFLERLRREGRIAPERVTRILDVGSGHGDMLRRVDRWAASHGLPVALTGADLNPFAARSAAEVTAPDRPIAWATRDAFASDEPYDIVISSLFTHHLADADVGRFLAWMDRRATTAWFVNDLHRHPAPYFGFGLLARLMRWHPFVQHDGPVSIARAFKAKDWRALLARAGVEGAQVRWRFPFRLCVSRVKAG